MQCMASSEDIVKTALSDLLEKHCIDESVSSIDDIVLSYILSILEDLGHDSCAEDVDVDHFVEMISAYLPGFREVSSCEVVEWMFELAAKLTASKSQAPEIEHLLLCDGSLDRTPSVDPLGYFSFQPVVHNWSNKGCVSSPDVKADSTSVSIEKGAATDQKDVTLSSSIPLSRQSGRRRISSSSDGGTKPNLFEEDDGMFEEQMGVLLELFPESCAVELSHCLQLTSGDTDSAAQLVLHRQETGTSIKPSGSVTKRAPQIKLIEDKKLKQLVLNRYAFVDTDEDKKTHIPPPVKQDTKKMVRYLGSQVVSTKGERYTELKKPESEEMKKTYVSLKPARKYRFH